MLSACQKQESGIQNKSYRELQPSLLIFLLLISANDICYEYPDCLPHNQMQYNTRLPFYSLDLTVHPEFPDYFLYFQLQAHY